MRLPAFAMLVLLSSPASAAFVLPCTPDDGREGIERALAALDRMTRQIERVSPTDADFFKSETEAALNDQNEGRYNLVIANPLYPAWEVWSVAAPIRTSLEAARDAEAPWQRIIDLADAQTGFVDLKEAMTSYRSHDAKRTKPVLSDNREQIYFDLAVIPGAIADTIRCTAASYR